MAYWSETVVQAARLAGFLAATLLPYAGAWWVRRNVPHTDRRRFEVVLLGSAVLFVVLHACAFTVGLSLSRVFLLESVVAVVVLAARRLATRSSSAEPPTPLAGPDSWTGTIAGWSLVLLAVSWVVSAAQSAAVIGTDAAHYHVPHAVNYALGATPWDPLATRHHYPMGMSLVFAWFMLPVDDPFIIDAAMLIPAALLVVSLARLFEQLTGEPGWRWAPWLSVWVFALPLIAAAAAPSADLLYTAAFLATAAQVVAMVRGDVTGPWAPFVLGSAVGLLVSSKVTGLYSAAAVGGVGVCGLAWRWFRSRGAATSGGAGWRAWAVGAAGLLAGAVPGLLWLLRNQLLFGRPVDAIGDPYYLSIANDMRTTYRHEWTYLGWRVARRLRQWAGPWFLASGWLVVLMLVETAWRLATRTAARVDRTRLAVLGAAAAVAVVHAAGMMRAPWTSLEHTSGASLRYLLPVWVLWVLLAVVAVFSRQWPWYRSRAASATMWAVAGVGVAVLAWDTTQPWWSGLARHAGAVALLLAAVGGGAWLWPRRSGAPALPAAVLRVAAALLLVVVVGGGWLAEQHAVVRAAAVAAERDEIDGRVALPDNDEGAYRRAFLAVRRDEAARGVVCQSRRWFLASRVDFPLAFQPPAYTSLVIDSRDAAPATAVLARPSPRSTCDYLVVHEGEMSRAIVARAPGREIAAPPPYRVFALVR